MSCDGRDHGERDDEYHCHHSIVSHDERVRRMVDNGMGRGRILEMRESAGPGLSVLIIM